MTKDIIEAVIILQNRNSNSFFFSAYWNERQEKALDLLLKNPEKTGNPNFLVRNAMSEAGHFLKRRNELAETVSYDADNKSVSNSDFKTVVKDPNGESAFEEIHLRHWVKKATLNETDREILEILLNGGDAADVGAHLGITVEQARVRVTRAQQRGRKVWRGEDGGH